MINAVPSSTNTSSGAGASPMPPSNPVTPTPPVDAQISINPDPIKPIAPAMVPPQVLPSQGVNSHGIQPDSGSLETPFSTSKPSADPAAVNTGETFSKDLKEKLNGNGVDDTVPSQPYTPPATPTPPVTATSEDTGSFNPPPQKPKGKFPAKGILAMLVLGLVVAGAGAAYYLTTSNTANLDNRNKAASEEVTGTERFTTDAEWKTFNQKWVAFNTTKHTWEEVVTFAMGEGARYECQKPILQVDKEVNYGCDLDAIFAISNNDVYIKAAAISPQDAELNKVLDHVITNSAILQTAATNNVVSLTPEIFNSPTKNMAARFGALATARESIGKDFVKKIDFEEITIYFHNEIDPSIPLEEAKTAAKAKMDTLYARLQSGAITMEQAGQEIAADAIVGDTTGVSLAQLDPNKIYPQNAYAKVTDHGFNDQIFTDPVYDEELKSLGEGQMSTVRTCKDYSFTFEQFQQANGDVTNFPFVDSCFIIFKLNKIKFGTNKDFEGATQAEVEEKIKSTAKVTKLN